jgi:hypothetical protein
MAQRKHEFIKGVRGKVVERIVVDITDYAEIDIRFKDGTSLGIAVETAGLSVRRANLLRWRKGNSHVVKELL